MSLYQLPLSKFNIYACWELPLNTVELICQHMTQLEDLNIGGLDITSTLPPLQFSTIMGFDLCFKVYQNRLVN